MSRPSDPAELEHRRALERTIGRFRISALAFTVVQTAIQPGDSALLSWAVVAALAATSAMVLIALRRRVGEQGLARVGVAAMAADGFIVAAILANNLRDPHDVIELVTILPAL